MIIVARMASVARPVRELRPTVPLALDAAIAKALERAPADRFATAGDFGAELAASLQPRVETGA